MHKLRSYITEFVQAQTGLDIHSIQVDLPFDHCRHYGTTLLHQYQFFGY